MGSIGDTQRLNFFIFGNNISHSLSPTIHNAAFKEFGLPHHYTIHQTSAIDDSIERILKDKTFGGASVTYPHKLSIQPLLNSQSDSAQKIGAVNTVMVQNSHLGRKLLGDNTDWLGLVGCIHRKLLRLERGIILGAGGAARAAVFAMDHVGIRNIVVLNRTRFTAERMAAQFPNLDIVICDRLADAPASDLIIGCIPADDIREEDIPRSIFNDDGLVIEMSYRPPVSALMKVAATQGNWMVLNGVDVLKEQAYAQFELWTGRKAPVDVIERALNNRPVK